MSFQSSLVKGMTGGNPPKAPEVKDCGKMYADFNDDCDSVVRVERWPGLKPHAWIQCYGYTGGEVPFLSPRQARKIAAALLRFVNDRKAYKVPSNEVILRFDPPWESKADVVVEAAGKKMYRFKAYTPKAKRWIAKNVGLALKYELGESFTLARKDAYGIMAKMKGSGLFVVAGTT